MEFLAAGLVGLLLALLAFLLLQWTARRNDVELSALVSGVRGEERLRTLEQHILTSLREVHDVTREVDRSRVDSLGRLDQVVRESQRSIDALQRSTDKLVATLSSSQARGQWGERMADDVLRAAGFVEGVQYLRNRQLDGGPGRPDFTFLLPEGRKLHMDVKFPIASYVRYIEAEAGPGSDAAERQFLADVRTAIKGVATRDYIDPAAGTLDFMLVFIPNEHIYSFVHQRDPRISEEALSLGVVLCSPLTLFALLSVIRQAADSFALAHAADEILRALGAFQQQWSKYRDAVDAVGRRIDSLQRAYDDLRGPRTRALERRLIDVEQLRIAQHLELPDVDDDEGEGPTDASRDGKTRDEAAGGQ